MEDMTLVGMILFAFFSLVGWMLIYTGVKGIVDTRRQQERERTMAAAVVVDYVMHERYVSQGRHRRGQYKRVVTWRPVLEFNAEGRVFRLESDFGYRDVVDERPAVGDEVEIRYDADDPAHFHLNEEMAWRRRFNPLTIVIGLAWVAFCAYLVVYICGLN